jgi:uncharacterized Zn finger protein (UPF0148 family)
MLRDKCTRCLRPMPVSTGELCPECDAYREAVKLDIKSKNPEATADQVLYAARRHLEATGWHSRGNYTDPREFSRSVPNPPKVN